MNHITRPYEAKSFLKGSKGAKDVEEGLFGTWNLYFPGNSLITRIKHV